MLLHATTLQVFRQVPTTSSDRTAVGRNFYSRNSRNSIAGGAEVWLGHYQSLRLTQVYTYVRYRFVCEQLVITCSSTK
jgi:Argonaute linker 1 domain